VYGRRITEEERAEVVKKQEAFFTTNPTWAEARPSCYIDSYAFTARSATVDTKADMLNIKDLISSNVIDLMARQVENSIV
jgi:hypothetical protein